MNCCYVVKFHQNPHIVRGIKQNEIVGGVLLGLQVVSLSAITFFTYSNICQLWRILLSYLFLIFVLSLPWKLISITFQSHLLEEINFYYRAFLLSLFCCTHFLETLIKSKILKFTLEKSTEESSSSPICINSLYAYEITPKGRSSQWPIKVTVGACHSNL